jgi:hypothetical protein
MDLERRPRAIDLSLHHCALNVREWKVRLRVAEEREAIVRHFRNLAWFEVDSFRLRYRLDVDSERGDELVNRANTPDVSESFLATLNNAESGRRSLILPTYRARQGRVPACDAMPVQYVAEGVLPQETPIANDTRVQKDGGWNPTAGEYRTRTCVERAQAIVKRQACQWTVIGSSRRYCFESGFERHESIALRQPVEVSFKPSLLHFIVERRHTGLITVANAVIEQHAEIVLRAHRWRDVERVQGAARRYRQSRKQRTNHVRRTGNGSGASAASICCRIRPVSTR